MGLTTRHETALLVVRCLDAVLFVPLQAKAAPDQVQSSRVYSRRLLVVCLGFCLVSSLPPTTAGPGVPMLFECEIHGKKRSLISKGFWSLS